MAPSRRRAAGLGEDAVPLEAEALVEELVDAAGSGRAAEAGGGLRAAGVAVKQTRCQKHGQCLQDTTAHAPEGRRSRARPRNTHATLTSGRRRVGTAVVQDTHGHLCRRASALDQQWAPATKAGCCGHCLQRPTESPTHNHQHQIGIGMK